MLEQRLSEALAEAIGDAEAEQQSAAIGALESAKRLRVAALGNLREQTNKTFEELEVSLQQAQDAVEISKVKERLMNSLRFERSKIDEIASDECKNIAPSEELALCSIMGQAVQNTKPKEQI